MKPEEVNKILSKVLPVWIERYGIQKIDPGKVQAIRNTLLMSPHNDGLMRVTLIGDDKTHLVPFEDMILNGLKGEDIKRYPIENAKN